MPTLTLGDKSVSVGDDFLKLSPEQQNATVEEISKSIGAAAPEGVTTNKVARAAATGVPLVGGLLNQADAATNAALAPILNPLFAEKDQLKGKTFSERRKEALAIQEGMDKKFEEEHPIVDTAAKITGGVAGTIPAMMAAPAAFGLTGTLPQMVTRGALSNAALSGADSAIRGENPLASAAVGGLVGAGAPLVGRGVGKLVQGVRDYRNPAPLIPSTTEVVAGVKIPLHQTTDPAIEAEKEIIRKGVRGTDAEAIARQADDEARAAIGQATENISGMMDPTGAVQRTAPGAAGVAVQSELAAQEAAKAAADAAQVSAVDAQGASLARGLGGGAAPVSPFDAAEKTGAAVAARRDAKVAATKELYKARDAVEGTFDPSVPQGLAEDIRARLNTGPAEERIHVDPVNESTASKALKVIDQTVGKDSGLFADAAAPKPASPAAGAPSISVPKMTEDETVSALRAKFGDSVADAYARQTAAAAEDAAAVSHGGFPGDAPAAVKATAAEPRPIDLRAMDDARKQLVTMYGDAKSKAIATGEKSDLRAMARILHEFDNSISDALARGKFSGDAKLAKELQDAARKSHSEYKETYSAKPGDEVGRAVEKILGRYSDTAATPEQIQALSYGPKGNPGTGNSVKVVGRLQKILSPEEYAQWKSGLFKYVDDAELSPAKRAARIDNFLQTSLAKAALTADDRSAMSAYSRNLRATEPPSGPVSKLQKDIARIAGTDGNRPATVDEVVKMLMAKNGDSQRLLVHLKPGKPGGVTQESWVEVKQGIFDDLINAPAGHNEYTALQLSKRLSDYVKSSEASVVNTPAELAEMTKLAGVYRRQVPLPGTTNPSGSAFFGQKIMKKAGNNLMTMLGFAHGGVAGAVVGHGIDALGGAVREARAAKEATRLFFGPQAKRAASTSRFPALIAPSAATASQR